MDCSPPGSSVQGIFQARVLEWVAISFSNVSNNSLLKSKTCLTLSSPVHPTGCHIPVGPFLEGDPTMQKRKAEDGEKFLSEEEKQLRVMNQPRIKLWNEISLHWASARAVDLLHRHLPNSHSSLLFCGQNSSELRWWFGTQLHLAVKKTGRGGIYLGIIQLNWGFSY